MKENTLLSPKRNRKHGRSKSPGPGRADPEQNLHRYAVRLRKVPGEKAWELVHPRCAQQRSEDIEEVRRMLEMDERDIARDELRWLLEDCSDFIDAHYLLGEIALAEGDVPLARGHYGYAFRLGTAALPRKELEGLLPYNRLPNRAFFDSGRRLAACLEQVGQPQMAREVLEQLLKLDPSDPLLLAGELARIRDARS